MSRIVILSAPQGTGKTRHALALARALRCTMIVDNYNGSQQLYPGTLALTHLPVADLDDVAPRLACEVIEAHTAADIDLIVRGAA